MIISLIAAVARNGVIGNHGAIPWHLPADFAYFKRITMGYPVIMGRKTYESIGKSLPGRKNIIVTRQSDYCVPQCTVVHDMIEAIREAGEAEEVFVIGGSEIYKEALPFAERLYITRVEEDFNGDVLFPEIDFSEWTEVSREKGIVDKENSHPHTFLVFERAS